MELLKKTAYLKGLVEGLTIDGTTAEGKIIRAMSDLMLEMAEQMQEMNARIEELSDQVDSLNEEVQDMEADLYVKDDEDEEDEEDEEEEACYEVDCPNCGELVYVTEADLEEKEAFCMSCGKSFAIELAEDEEEDEDEEDAQYEVTCTKCGAVTVLDEDTLVKGDIVCSGCGAILDIDCGE